MPKKVIKKVNNVKPLNERKFIRFEVTTFKNGGKSYKLIYE